MRTVTDDWREDDDRSGTDDSLVGDPAPMQTGLTPTAEASLELPGRGFPVTGFVPSGSRLDQVLDLAGTGVDSVRLFNADAGGFLGQNLPGATANGFFPANRVGDLQAEAGKYFIKTFTSGSGSSDWRTFRLAETDGGEGSLLGLKTETVPTNSVVEFDDVLDLSALDGSAQVRVFIEDVGDFGFMPLDEVRNESVTTPGDELTGTVWLDTWVRGEGRSGWSRTEIDVSDNGSIQTVGGVEQAAVADSPDGSAG